MIQRIQSIWLLLSTCGITAIAILAFKTNTPSILIGVFCILTAFLTLIAVFLYKKRKTQLRLVQLSLLLKGTIFGFFVYQAYKAYVENSALQSFILGAILFALSILFDALATRGVKKDEELVRSMDRIR